MNLIINPGKNLFGEVSPPGDKSISLRFALFASLAQGKSRADHFLMSGITKTILAVLSDLQVMWRVEDEKIIIEGNGIAGLVAPTMPINCGNSATTLRLLAGVLAAAGIPAVLDGSPSLKRRPMQRMIEPLQEMGVNIGLAEGGILPITLTSRPLGENLHSAHIQLPVASAQVKTSILLAALASNEEVTIQEPCQSRDHSERLLNQMGVRIERIDNDNSSTLRIFPIGKVHLQPLQIHIPGDFSAAAFLIVAGLITPRSHLILRRVGLNPTRTGLLIALQEMGANISIVNSNNESIEPIGDLIIQSSRLHGINISGERVVQMIDEFPVFSIAAAMAKGITTVNQAEELRYKESDRISVICSTLKKLGIQVQENRDGFVIYGSGKILGGITIDSHGDHRIAMAFAVAGIAARHPLQINNAEIIDESYPEFISTLSSLGANIKECD